MKVKFTVPPTNEVGSYSGIASGNTAESFRANALWDYNSCRAHDGLEPLTRMPNGTKYTLIKEVQNEAIICKSRK